jgi:phosphate transport system permease protein
LIFLLQYSLPAIRFNGLGFFTSIKWDLGNLNAVNFITRNGVEGLPGASYGVLVLLTGTLASSAIALLLAIPTSVAVALFTVEEAPHRVREPLTALVDLLAGVPSVVYGLWGVVVLVPLMRRFLAPGLASIVGFVPFFGGVTGAGYGLLTAGLVLSLMVTPIISSTVREAFAKTPIDLKEGALALGCTKWEMERKVVLPFSKTTITGASLLGLGRAFGETMAILMVGGGALNYLPGNIYSPISTMATAIVSLLDSAFTDPTNLAIYSLAEVALVLFLITLAANMLARMFVSGGVARAFVSRSSRQ